jgi:imidazolonepropionase-like amidohydrolase
VQLVLAGGRIYTDPDSDAIADGTIVIDGATIAAAGRKSDVTVPTAAEVVDCTGKTIVAGFWNSHVHFFERKWANANEIPADELAGQLRDFTRYGFTTVFDLSSLWENTQHIRSRVDSQHVLGPAIRTTGEGLVPPNAVPPETVTRVLGAFDTPLPVVTRAAQAAAEAKRLLQRGADGIKMFVSSQRSDPLAEETMRAAVHEAHAAGKPVFVHPSNGADIVSAVRAGVDVIAHTTPGSGAWDEQLLSAMHDAGTALTPTLTLWQYAMRHDRLSLQERYVETSVAQLRSWAECGGDVLFGTDYGAVDADPRNEYALMARAGMSFRDVLASLTAKPAARFKAERSGRIAQGFVADIVVLNRDPARELHALADVLCTIRTGKLVYRSSEGRLTA